ncbi:MAG: PQQ-binding-like beta-propeller repeat protein, partial [Candidatus Lokiarchaeota archaeon]|nr:PQQ-binding-like beta-propeller repeat protein [Candidatus Lokiarchaeota archaeon]
MKIQTKFKKYYKILTLFVIVFILIVPVIELVVPKSSIKKSPINSKTPSNNSDINAILWKFGQGLIGEGPTMQPRLVRFTEEGEQFVVVGTDGGLAVINLDGFINMTYITFKEVIDFDLIDDISGDDAMDIVLNTYDQERPNVFAVSSKDGEELWSYTPKVESIASDTFATQEYIPYTWDVKTISDINGDGTSDVVISSWYKLIALNGKTGNEIWVNDADFTNDIWKIEFYNNTIVAGSENGELIAIDPENGQKMWINIVPPTRMVAVSRVGFVERDVPNSIDDILIINDVDNDSFNELLVSSDDGIIRLISGSTGAILDEIVFYKLTTITEELSTSMGLIHSETADSPYSSESRIFRASGAKFFEFPDINGDGKREYLVIACQLDYSWRYMFERWINATIFNVKGKKLNILERFGYSEDPFWSSSYTTFVDNGAEIRMYFYIDKLPMKSCEESAGVYWFNFDDKDFENFTLVYRDRDLHGLNYKWPTGYYVLNVGDINNNGVDDLIAISRLGKCLLIDCKNNETIWVRSLKRGESKLTEIQDVNGDGTNDLLYKKIKDFEPSWSDSIVEDGLISEFLILDAKNGDIIWEFKTPSPQYYEGLRSVLNIGDINGDSINDYAAWMIPSEIPQEVTNLVKSLSGNPFLNLYDKERETAIYRALMGEYTRLLVINGSNGLILWDTPLIDFPYRFYRDFGNFGNYTNPSGLYSNGGNYYLRRNSQLPESWRNDWNEILWENEWTPSTLLHANKIGIEFGEYSSGNIYDLSDIHGNYTLKANKQLSGSIWKTVLNLTIPLDFSNEKRMGLIEYPLSQMERLAAFKMQSSLLVNDSSEPEWYNFTYEIYKESTNEWVLCNWTGNKYWDLRYLDLFGNFKDTNHSGYRNNYKFFNFSTD